MISIRIKTAALIVTGLAAAGCSVQSYEKPVSDFASATAEAATALSALDQRVTQAYADRIVADVVSERRTIVAESGDCNLTGSTRCRLVAVALNGSREPFNPDARLREFSTLMGTINTYAQNLSKIVDSDTASEAAGNVNATLGSIENLANSLDEARGTAIAKSLTPYKQPVEKLATWIIGQYVARVQLDGLRRATAAADPVIQGTTTWLLGVTTDLAEPIFNSASHTKYVNAMVAFEDLQGSGDERAFAARVGTVTKRASEYDRILRAQPSTIYSSLATAHAELARSLNEDPTSFSSAAARIQGFADEVKTLVEILREFSAIEEN